MLGVAQRAVNKKCDAKGLFCRAYMPYAKLCTHFFVCCLMIVMKFGGTSVRTASAMRSASACVQAHLDKHPLVVLSACGGMTNELLALARAAGQADSAGIDRHLHQIREHHRELCLELFVGAELRTTALDHVDSLVNELHAYVQGMAILCECTPQSMDTVASFGERLSSAVFVLHLQECSVPSVPVEATHFMKTSDNYTGAEVNMSRTRECARRDLLPHITNGRVIVTQGFLGLGESGNRTTLGRGGSDVSAAIIGAVLEADEIQIWTDVNGVMSADPRIVPDARTLAEITFSELRDLSWYGAKVVHPDTIKPAIDAGVPVTIRNTFDPDNSGTVAIPDNEALPAHIRAVSVRRACTRVVLRVSVNSSGHECYKRLLDCAAEHSCQVVLGTLTDTEAMIVVPSDHAHAFSSFAECTPADVICVCGPNLRASDILTPVTKVLLEYSPYAVVLGAGSAASCAVVSPEHSTELVRALHDCTQS